MRQLVILALLVASCKSGSQAIAEAVVKDPTLLKVREVVLHDTIIFAGPKSAIAINIPSEGKAVAQRTQNDIEISIQNTGDTALQVAVECPTDTHYVTKVEHVPQVVLEQKEGDFMQPFGLGFMAGIFMAVLGAYMVKN